MGSMQYLYIRNHREEGQVVIDSAVTHMHGSCGLVDPLQLQNQHDTAFPVQSILAAKYYYLIAPVGCVPSCY